MKDAKLVARTRSAQHTVISLSDQVAIGGRNIVVIAGPCAVESLEQMEQIAQSLSTTSIHALRGGVYKPRTSPYSFQGMGIDGLRVLATVRQQSGFPVVTEVMSIAQLETVCAYADMVQIGSRNMQNFELLKALGKVDRPILLKRGLAATVEEFVMAAEYILAHGNPNVVLCERGIRSFDSFTRNVLDLGAVVALKQLTHLPVIVDPSHAAGKRELVPDLSRAAIACGADGLLLECHPIPEQSVSDARQALSLDDMTRLVTSLKPVAEAIGRSLSPLPLPTPTGNLLG
jgi:3-deoxy-7-phosphoheptulonate synthase